MHLVTEANRRWLLLGAVSCLLGLILLDETALGVALPTIQSEFGLSSSGSHWAINAYALPFACLVAVGGKLADMFGILKMFLIGLAIFGISSVCVALAPSGAAMIAGRAIQGVGAAICFPLFVAMITITFPKTQRGSALGICAGVGTLFLAAGPFAGGLLTEYYSWRGLFWINPVVVAVVALVSILTWRDVPRPPVPPMDWLGLLLFVPGLFCVVFALMQGDDWGWQDPVILASAVLGVLLLSGFVWAEIHTKQPLIMVGLFSNRVFAAGNLTMFIAQFAKMPIFIFAALYARQVLGLSPLGAGAMVTLAAIIQPLSAPICGRLTDRIPAGRLVAFGQICLLVCLLWLMVTAPLGNLYLFAPGLLFAGIAFPFMFIPSQTALMAGLPRHMHGQGGGISISSQMIGGTIGLAASSAMFSGRHDYQLVFGAAAVGVLIVMVYSLHAFFPARRANGSSDRIAELSQTKRGKQKGGSFDTNAS